MKIELKQIVWNNNEQAFTGENDCNDDSNARNSTNNYARYLTGREFLFRFGPVGIFD